MEFSDGDAQAAKCEALGSRILALLRAAYRTGAPYANDPPRRTSSRRVGRPRVAAGLHLTRRDCFALEARSSPFLHLPRAVARRVGVKTQVIGGLTADTCVLFTAHDAYSREVPGVVPPDAVASERA